MPLDYDMTGTYNASIASGIVLNSDWGDDVNINLDDKISQTSDNLGTTGNLSFDTTNDEITRASGSWIADGVSIGVKIIITGSVSNNGTFTVTSVESATVIRVAENLTTEGAVAAIARLAQPIASHLLFGTSRFPRMVSDPVDNDDGTRKSWIDTNFLNKVISTSQNIGGSLALASSKYVTVNNGKVLSRWDEANPTSQVRWWSFNPLALINKQSSLGNDTKWTLDDPNGWVEMTVDNGNENWKFPLHLPHNCTITNFHIYGQEVGGGNLAAQYFSYGYDDFLADGPFGSVNTTTTMQNNSGTQSDNIDNELYVWYFVIVATTGFTELRLRSVRIEYTVVDAQP
jgi:hypothetical protein